MRMAYWLPNKSASPTPFTRRIGSSTVAEMKLPSWTSVMLAFVDDSAKNIRKLKVALVTVTPACWTVIGRLGVANCNLFCTCTWALSGSVPGWKYNVTAAEPLELLLEEI